MAEVTMTEEYPVFGSFDDIGIKDNILRGIYSFGFEVPSTIQARAIKPMMDRRDVIAQSQSGTGKTGAFSIGTISVCDPAIKAPQAIILSPVRELAHQTDVVMKAISSYADLQVYSATGGPPIAEDIRALQRGAQSIIGTPGRI